MELQIIQNKIYEIRGIRVMLDFDLANLYDVETRVLKQAVKRNINRFPEDFMFELTKNEWQEVITICDNLPETIIHSPATAFAFSEQGVAILSSVLRSKKAIEVNISIMRICSIAAICFRLRRIESQLDEFMIETNVQFSDIYEALTELASQKNWITSLEKELDMQDEERSNSSLSFMGLSYNDYYSQILDMNTMH